MNDTRTPPAAAAPPAGRAAPPCPPWCAGSHDEPGRPVHRTARTEIALPGHAGYLSTRCIEIREPGPEAVVHGSWQDGGAEAHCGLYVPLDGAGDLAALLEVLAHATPRQHRELAAAVRAAAAAVTGQAPR